MSDTIKPDSKDGRQETKKICLKDTWQPALGQIARSIQFAAIVIGMLVVVHELMIQLPKDRRLRDAQLHATIATLATEEDVDVTGHAIQKIMELMYRDGDDDIMIDISVPNTRFNLADFEGVDWSGAYMENVEFTCTDGVDDEIRNWSKDRDKVRYCANLQEATFSDSTMDGVRFYYANLHNSKFINTRLHQAHIEHSILSESSFSGAKMRGIQIDSSDFTDTDFGRSIKFDCKRRYDCRGYKDRTCASLKRVDFSAAKMPRARFYGTDIRNVDFSGANLEEARFLCDEAKGEEKCTTIEGACLHDTILTDAQFEGVTIMNSDLSTADISKAHFRDVQFENVVFSDAQLTAVTIDEGSLYRLHQARSTDLGLDQDETPCTQAWHQELTQWQEKLAYHP